MSKDQLGDLKHAFQWVYAYFDDVCRLFKRTRRLMSDVDYDMQEGNKVYFTGSQSLDRPEQWLPDYHFQFFRKIESKNLLAVLIEHYDVGNPKWTPQIYLVCFTDVKKLRPGAINYHWDPREDPKEKKGRNSVFSGTAQAKELKKVKYSYKKLDLKDIGSLGDVTAKIVDPLIKLDK